MEDDAFVTIWSIGLYAGATPFDLKPAPDVRNPILSARDVSDVRAEFVADPFMIRRDDTWHMLFEVMNAETGKGEIGWATCEDGMGWTYRQIVLREAFHLSYPYLFAYDGSYYMLPESHEAQSLRLYRADSFPVRWRPVASLMEGTWVDASIGFFEGRWWIFASPAYGRLELFFANDLQGPWRAHPLNPIVEGDVRRARPGGRVLVYGDRPLRFAQDGVPEYGTQVRAFEIVELTPSTYREREVEGSPVLCGGDEDWNRLGMHHVDPHPVDRGWLACVDGWRNEIAGADAAGTAV